MEEFEQADQYNAWQCESCEEWTPVEPENSRLIFYEKFSYMIVFMGECGNCDSQSYRFVPVSKLDHFDFLTWRETHNRPEQSVKEAWHRTIGQSIDKQVGEFALKLEHTEPFDFRD